MFPCECRFTHSAQKNQLSRWLRPLVREFPFHTALQYLKSFFHNMAAEETEDPEMRLAEEKAAMEALHGSQGLCQGEEEDEFGYGGGGRGPGLSSAGARGIQQQQQQREEGAGAAPNAMRSQAHAFSRRLMQEERQRGGPSGVSVLRGGFKPPGGGPPAPPRRKYLPVP